MEEQFLRTQYPTIFRDIEDDTLWYCIVPEDGQAFTVDEINERIRDCKTANPDSPEDKRHRKAFMDFMTSGVHSFSDMPEYNDNR
jgi:hypothetical protein